MAKIAHFCSVATLDVGSPISTLKTAELFASQFETVVVLPEEGPFSEALTQKGIGFEIIPFPRLRRFKGFFQAIAYIIATARASIRLFFWLRRDRVDLVHFSDLIDVAYLPAARLSGAKVVTHLRCILGSGIARGVYRMTCALFGHEVICVSRATREAMFGVNPSSGRVIYNPGPDPLFLSEPVEAPAGVFRMLAIGKFLEVKGHANLIGLSRKLEEQDFNFQVTIIGRKQPGHEQYYENCQTLIDQYGLRDRFEIVPYLPPGQVAERLDRSNVFVHLPNYQEPFPGVVLEAMARERAVVAFDSGGIREQFEDGRSGFLIPQGDIDAASEVVKRLIDEPELRRSVGQNARRFLLENFNRDRYREEMGEVYRDVLKGAT